MRYQTAKTPEHQANLFADALAVTLVFALPLFMPNGYVNLIGEKFALLLACTAVGTAALAGALLVKGKEKPALNKITPAWLWPVGLCAAYTVAWLFAEDPSTAFWGLDSRYNGLLLLLVCTLVFLVVAAFSTAEGRRQILHALQAAGTVATAVSWLNYWMLDPLDAYYTFLPERGELFLGPMGNINFYGALLCLCVPVAVYEYLRRGGGRWCWRGWLAWFLCTGLIPSGSDGAWLGCAAAVVVLCCMPQSTTRTLARLMALTAGVIGSAVATGALAGIFPTRRELQTFSAVLSAPGMLVLCLLCAAGAWWLHRQQERCVAVPVRIAAGAVVILAAAFVLGANFLPDCPAWLQPLRFNERWGANRGYAWQRLWIIYTQDTTWWQKLIGLGGDAVAARLSPDIESIRYMILLNGDVFDSAHNEFLQHLVCGGLLGLVCWCGFLVGAVVRGLRACPAVAAALIGYGVQSFFSISMPGAFPLVFVLAGLTYCRTLKERSGGGLVRWRWAAVLLMGALAAMPFLPGR